MNHQSNKKSNDPFMDWMYEAVGGEVPNSDTDLAWNKLQAKIQPVRKKQSNAIYFRIAAGLSLIAICSYLFIGYLDQPTMLEIAGTGQSTELVLPDGSHVTLTAGSQLSYPETFDETRSVALTGEAYFDIQKSNIPFVINLNEVNVRVLGTAFNVNAKGDEIRVFVERGLVALEKNNKQVKIAKGQTGIFKKKTYEIRVDTTPDTNVLGWRTGLFEFNETPLEEALVDLGKYYNVSFKIAAPLKNCRITANFNQASLEEVLAVFETILSVTVTQEKSIVRIKGKGCQ